MALLTRAGSAERAIKLCDRDHRRYAEPRIWGRCGVSQSHAEQ
jgi:hypothetical protein